RRGLVMSACRGVVDGSGGYVLKCIDTDYYTSADAGGSCDSSLGAVVGVYAGSTKQTQLCNGGSRLGRAGTPVYQTTHLYDAHGRSCSVVSKNSAGQLILGQTYTYDQFDNLVAETSASALDGSTDSNYQMAYGYDGMMRLLSATRNDASGNFLQSTAY